MTNDELGYFHYDGRQLVREHAGIDRIIAGHAELSDGEFLWVDLTEPSRGLLTRIVEWLKLPSFVVRDSLHAHRRARSESYGDRYLLAARTLWYVESKKAVDAGEVSCLIAEKAVVTIRHGQHNPIPDAQTALSGDPELLRLGPWAVTYAIFDRIIAEYLAATSHIDSNVSDVERIVFSGPRVDMVEDIYSLKREVLEFRDAIQPLQLIAQAQPPEWSQAQGGVAPYFRDLGHRILRVGTSIEASENLLSSILDSHLGQISMWQNEDMRKISAWAAIIGAPTVVTGIYGMNFTHMPELHWVLSYPIAMAALVIACTLLYRGFRRNGWL